MIRLLLVFAESGLPYYTYKVPVPSPEKEIDDTFVSSLLSALAILAKTVMQDEISKIDLKSHQILFQKWNFFTEDYSETLTFAMICKDVYFSNPLSLARLQGLLLRLMLRYQTRFKSHVPNSAFEDVDFDSYVKGEMSDIEKKLLEQPYPQISLRLSAANVKMWDYGPNFKEHLSLVWNKLWPAFKCDCSIEFGENYITFHYLSRADLAMIFVDETFPSTTQMAQDFKTFFSAAKNEETTICFQFLKFPDDETLNSCLNMIKRFYLWGQVRNEADIGVKEVEKSIYITLPTFKIYVASIEIAHNSLNRFLQLK